MLTVQTKGGAIGQLLKRQNSQERSLHEHDFLYAYKIR